MPRAIDRHRWFQKCNYHEMHLFSEQIWLRRIRSIYSISIFSMKSLTLLAIASAFSIPLLTAQVAKSAAEYCHYTNGNYVCIEKVFGPRNNRGIIYTSNGNVYSARINCYARDYHSTSLNAVACWNYTGIKAEPENLAEIKQMPDSLKGIMTEGGFISSDKAIDLDKVMNAMPPEMK